METEELPISRKFPQLQKLNRLPSVASARFSVFGVRVALRANALEFLDPLIARIPSGWQKVGSGSVDRVYSVIGGTDPHAHEKRQDCNLLFANLRSLATAASWGDLCDIFESDLESFIARRSRSALFVHAGAVSWKGQAIVIPGESRSGKTTLVQAFLELGATYYSDEFAVFDSEGLVHPFPRPLSIRTNLGSIRIPAERLGVQVGVAPAHMRVVILTRHMSGMRWSANSSSQAVGILGLIQNTLIGRRYPKLALSTLRKATQLPCGLELEASD
jgi:hypothetical protein